MSLVPEELQGDIVGHGPHMYMNIYCTCENKTSQFLPLCSVFAIFDDHTLVFLYDYLECMNGIKLSSQFKLHILFLSSVIQCSFTYQTCYHLTKSVSGEKSSL